MSLVVLLYCVGVVAGLVGLWWSSDKSVEYSLQLSDLFGITTFFIGFVLVAVATGLPELAIAITSLWNNVPGVAAGTILGSNLGDVSLVLGLPAVILGTLNVRTEDKLPLMLMLMVTALVMAFVFIVGVLTPLYGVVLMFLYGASIWWLWKTKVIRVVPQEEVVEELSSEEKIHRKPWSYKLFVVFKLLAVLFLVLVTSKIAIDSAVALTKHFPLSLEALGATIFAVGTSLPELAFSFQSVRKKEYSLAFGNSFGSILEQATLILGVLVLGSKNPVDIKSLRPIAPIMFLSYAIVAHTLLKKTKVGRQEGLGRREGFVLLGLFILNVVYYLFFNG